MEENKINKRDNSLQVVAKVFLTFCCAFYSIIAVLLLAIFAAIPYIWLLGFVPLCWLIPMTVIYFKSIDENEDVSITFKICVFLFVSRVAGIAMIADGVTKNLYDAIQKQQDQELS